MSQSFDELLSAGDPEPSSDPLTTLVDGKVPIPVLRQWSDALAAAGMFREALLTHPAVERADLVRRAELAVLAADHLAARSLLAELPAGSPWLEVLDACAQVLAGEPGLLPDVLAAARKMPTSAAVAWVVALAAIAADDLGEAAPAAVAARAGGCRDLRILAISAADRAAGGDTWAAIEVTRAAQKIALPDEDPAALVVLLLERAGLRDVAQRLSVRGALDVSLPPQARAAWQAAARSVGAGRKQPFRRLAMRAGQVASRRREQAEQLRQEAAEADLTCRCYASTGWIGPSRMVYVTRHLDEVLPVPVPGLKARLVRCRATNLAFLDFPARQLTLPVPCEVTATDRPLRVDPFADPDAGPEARPTPGMGLSLGMALPA